MAQDHTEGHRANRLPCAQVGEDTGPPKLVTPTNADDPDINRGSIGQRNLNPPRETHRSDRIKEIMRDLPEIMAQSGTVKT